MQIKSVLARGQTPGYLFPGVSPIGAANHTGHFQGGVHLVGEIRVGAQGNYSGRKGHVDLSRSHGFSNHLPGVSAVRAAVNLSGRGTQVHHTGVAGSKHERPRRSASLGVVQSLPAITTAVAPERAVLSAGVNHFRIVWVNNNSVHHGVYRQTFGELLPLRGTRC